MKAGTGNYYKDVMAAKKELVNCVKELKVHKIEKAATNMQACIGFLQPYAAQRFMYTVPAQGGQAKSGPGF